MDDTVENLARGLVAGDETRTVAQLRSDVLVDLVLGGTAGGSDVLDGSDNLGESDLQSCAGHSAQPGLNAEIEDELSTAEGLWQRGTERQSRSAPGLVGRGVRPTVIVTVPVMTLLGRTEEPGDLERYGPIDAETARELARHAPSFIRILTHPETGATLSVGRQRYRPPADLRTALEIEDQTCRFPGCARAARRCELDHTVDWARGGQTSHTNLAHLCPKHHHLKHETKWAVRQEADRALRWTSPLGREYVTTPESRFPDAGVDSGGGAVSPGDVNVEPAPLEPAPLEPAPF
ncbi:HNH endonuclease [Subtercola sp. PAMC28395]|nr:HNH endonuclease [Subtercola sp. PAMC28395]